MDKTEQYGLNLPGGNDYADIENLNENARKVDAALWEQKQQSDHAGEALEDHEQDTASHLTDGAQTFEGVKTFQQSPEVPEPTKPGNPIRKVELDKFYKSVIKISNRATEEDIQLGEVNNKWVSPLGIHKQIWSPLLAISLGSRALVRIYIKTADGLGVGGVKCSYTSSGVETVTASTEDGAMYLYADAGVETIFTLMQPIDVQLSRLTVIMTNPEPQSIHDIGITATLLNLIEGQVYEIPTSQVLGYFSSRVKSFDAWCCGGGGSGACVSGSWGGAGYYVALIGGAGAYTFSKFGIINEQQKIVATTGAGGSGASANGNTKEISGHSGGTTTLKIGDESYTANGGTGGSYQGGDSLCCSGRPGGSGSGGVGSYGVGIAGSDGSNGGSYNGAPGGSGQGSTTRNLKGVLCCGAGGSCLGTYKPKVSSGGDGGGSASKAGSGTQYGYAPTAPGAGSGAVSAASTTDGSAYSKAGANGLAQIKIHI